MKGREHMPYLELEDRVRQAIHWSFNTWHMYGYEDPTDITVSLIAGDLYYVRFAVRTHVPWTIHALFLDVKQGQPSLFFDSDTLAVIRSFILENERRE
jgi:hypothetical protein